MKKFFLRVSFREQGLQEAARELLAGAHRDDVLEKAVRALELDPADDSLGFGGAPNILGVMELDGVFMDGNTMNCGAVAGIINYLPVKVARRLMQAELHTLLVGQGAETFAREAGLEPDVTLSDFQRKKWEKEIKPLVENRGSCSLMDLVKQLSLPQNKNADTTVMITSDGNGISGAASTAGWDYCHPGRVGDTPIIGAGMYVDSRYGGAACTHTGEMATRGGIARYVVAQMQAGKSVGDAVKVGAAEISNLKGGVLRTLVIHAIDKDGESCVAAINAEEPIYYQYWREGMAAPERRQAEEVNILPRGTGLMR